MGTPAGFAAYRDSRINGALKAILAEWCEFLNTPASLYVLNDSPQGWKCAKARADVGMEQFQHDPADEHWGFTSWNDSFSRRLVEGARPVAAPDDDSVIVSACESTPYGLRTDVRLRDRFWLKGQPYSLRDMLDNDEAVAEFAGGTVYQAFLSATNYHRWHSPVAGHRPARLGRRRHLLLRGAPAWSMWRAPAAVTGPPSPGPWPRTALRGQWPTPSDGG